MKKTLMSILTLGMVISNTYAGCVSNSCNDVKITTLYPTFGGRIYVGTSGDETKATICTPISGSLYEIDPRTPGKKEMFATLLSVKRADETIKVRVYPRSQVYPNDTTGRNQCIIVYVSDQY